MADALLTIENLTKSVGEKLLFDNISFGINAGQKSALIARNGAGKSTLLNLIMSASPEGKVGGYNIIQDSGTITFRGNIRVAYLPQNPITMPSLSVREYIYHTRKTHTEEEWVWEQRASEVLSRMKMDTMLDRQICTLSGGEQKKVALCHLLIDDYNLLILDEPTNHLDIGMIEWLESFLARQHLALLMVTHDRYFLDNVCQDIYELDHAQLFHYKGGYTYYLEKKAEREAAEQVAMAKARSLYRTELEWMRRMPQARGTKAQARKDAFYSLEQKVHTRHDDNRPQLSVKAERIGGKVLEVNNICYAHPSQPANTVASLPSDMPQPAATPLINDFSYTFKRGEKIGIVGPNGVGKSTFLNLLTQKIKPTSGHISVGQTIRFGYYTQSGMNAPDDQRVIDLVKDIAEQIVLNDNRTLSAHQFLSYFGFDDTVQYNYFGNLSGGERRRLYLLRVLMANPNFLILDEPTNDLDIFTLQILEQFLQSYNGCLMMVSHDRSFLDHLVDHLFVFEGHGVIKDYYSTYTNYRLAKEASQKADRQSARASEPSKHTNPIPQQPAPKQRLTYREQKEYETLTQEITQLTAERAELESKLSVGDFPDTETLTQATIRIGQIIALLDEKELRWLELDEYR